LRNPVSRRSLK